MGSGERICIHTYAYGATCMHVYACMYVCVPVCVENERNRETVTAWGKNIIWGNFVGKFYEITKSLHI